MPPTHHWQLAAVFATVLIALHHKPSTCALPVPEAGFQWSRHCACFVPTLPEALYHNTVGFTDNASVMSMNVHDPDTQFRTVQ